MNGQPITDIIGLYADRLPPAQPTLAELVERAIATSDALLRACGHGRYISDAEYCRCDEAAFDARADLRAALMTMGLSRRQIDLLGKVL